MCIDIQYPRHYLQPLAHRYKPPNLECSLPICFMMGTYLSTNLLLKSSKYDRKFCTSTWTLLHTLHHAYIYPLSCLHLHIICPISITPLDHRNPGDVDLMILGSLIMVPCGLFFKQLHDVPRIQPLPFGNQTLQLKFHENASFIRWFFPIKSIIFI